MKKLVVLVAYLYASTASAETIVINIEHTLPNGPSSLFIESGNGGCSAAKKAGPYGGCVSIPPGQTVRQCSGTVTLKIPNVELLHRIICGSPGLTYTYSTIWQGHMVSSLPAWGSGTPGTAAQGTNTLHILTPLLRKDNGAPQDPLITGPSACWSEYQANNYGPASPNGGGFEVQVTCSTE